MGSEAEEQSSAPPKLPLFSLSLPPMKSPEHYGWMVTPPHHTASIPFRWEEEPGKPRSCKDLSLPSSTTATATHFKCLELPPRLLYEANFNNTPSPTTVLKGPYAGKSIFHSFRLSRDRQMSYFDGSGGGSGASSPERGLLGTIVFSKRGLLNKERGRGKSGFFGLWGKRTFGSKQGQKDRDSDGASFAFSSISDEDIGGDDGKTGGERAEMKRITGKTSFLGLTKASSHFWATIYGAVKQVIPRMRNATKWKKDL